jgi:hypothetical protein
VKGGLGADSRKRIESEARARGLGGVFVFRLKIYAQRHEKSIY